MRISGNFKGQSGRNVQAVISGADLTDAQATDFMEAVVGNLMNKSGGDVYYSLNSVNKTRQTGKNGMSSDAQEDTADVVIKYSSGAKDYYWFLLLPDSVTEQTIVSKFNEHYPNRENLEVTKTSSDR